MKKIFLLTLFAFFSVNASEVTGYTPLSVHGCPSLNQFGKDHFSLGSSQLAGCEGSKNPALGLERIFRGGVPNQDGINCLRSMGITAVIDLQTESNIFKSDESDLVDKAGMKFFQFPMEAMMPTPASSECAKAKMSTTQCNQMQVIRFAKILKQYLAENPSAKVYVHCTRGQDRTGLALGFFRVKVQGCSKESARAEMNAFKYNPYKPLEGVWENIDQINL